MYMFFISIPIIRIFRQRRIHYMKTLNYNSKHTILQGQAASIQRDKSQFFKLLLTLIEVKPTLMSSKSSVNQKLKLSTNASSADG